MSPQQMNFDEINRDGSASYSTGYEGDPRGTDYSLGSFGQKLSGQETGKAPTTAQRLALAIVSLSMLLVLIFTELWYGARAAAFSMPYPGFVQSLLVFALLLFFAAAIVINIVFNRRR